MIIFITRLMLAYGQHNLYLCGDPGPNFWAFKVLLGPLALFWGLGPCFGAFGGVLGLWALFWGLNLKKPPNK